MSVARCLAVAAATLTVAAVGAPTAIAAQPDTVGKKVVVLKDSVADPGAVAAEHGNRYGALVSHVYGSALKGYAAAIPSKKLAELRKDSRVAFVSDDVEFRIAGQTTPTGINRIDADSSSQSSGNNSGAVPNGAGDFAVAVIDTGSGPHSDLNVVGGKNCIGGSKSFADGNGHGTHVAGTIGAKDDGVGVVGVAPGVKIYSVRVLNDRGSGSLSAIACGIDWVTANAKTLNIKVASMSLGAPGSDNGNCGNGRDAMHLAICRSVGAGVTYVAAAGNSNVNMNSFVPAAYNEVLTVTAAADYDGLPGGASFSTCRAGTDEAPADFSNWTTPGSADAAHTIAAPGVCIDSTYLKNGYTSMSGTSMAAPHVSGIAALCLASGDCAAGATPADIRAELLSKAAAQQESYGFVGDAFHSLNNRYYGHLAFAGDY